MSVIIKTDFRLLLRTKAFWFFLLMMPVLSTMILKIKTDSSAAYVKGNEEMVKELESANDKVAYYGGKGEYIIKVYDASGSELSDYMLNRLSTSGMFYVCRVNLAKTGDALTQEFLQEHLAKDGYEDRMGAAIFIASDFDEKAEDALTVYFLSEDERGAALEAELTFLLSKMDAFLGDVKLLEQADAGLPEKKVVSVAVASSRNLTVKQTNQKTQIGYALAFLSLGFVFCGIFVAHTAIKEQKNGVLTRIDLTGTSTLQYFTAKFVTVLLVSVMVTCVMSVCSIFLNMYDLGMSRFTFLSMIFMMGLIFSALSLLLGILTGEVMSANVAAFSAWCLTALMSGLYFPLTYTSKALKVLSFFMPQRWFLEGSEMIFVGDNQAFLMLICVTVAYLVVILSLGGLGLKIRGTEEWGNS